MSSPFSLRSRRQADTPPVPQQRQLATVSASGTDGGLVDGEATQSTTATAEPEKTKASEQSKIDGFWPFMGTLLHAALELIKSDKDDQRKQGFKILRWMLIVFVLVLVAICGTAVAIALHGGTLSAGNVAIGVGAASASGAAGKIAEAAKSSKSKKNKG